MAQGLGNNFPDPWGAAAVSFTNVQPGATTANFTFAEAGLYTIALNLDDLFLSTDQVLLQKVSGSTTTTLLTMLEPGYYDIVLPTGGYTMNFNTTNKVKKVSMTMRYRQA